MSDLHIPGTQSTPAIQGDWQAGRLSMQGDSYPENSYELFGQVIDWVERFLAAGQRPRQMRVRRAPAASCPFPPGSSALSLLRRPAAAAAPGLG